MFSILHSYVGHRLHSTITILQLSFLWTAFILDDVLVIELWHHFDFFAQSSDYLEISFILECTIELEHFQCEFLIVRKSNGVVNFCREALAKFSPDSEIVDHSNLGL